MPNPLFVVGQPQLYDYSEFFDHAIPRISKSATFLNVFVFSIIQNANKLNTVLLFLYAQIRAKLYAANFLYHFGITVLVNKSFETQYSTSQVFFVANEITPALLRNPHAVSVKTEPTPLSVGSDGTSCSVDFRGSRVVAVGGTFDHLHDGHKILLLMAAFVAGKTLIVGVAGPNLLQNKKYSSALQSLDLRIQNTCNFLQKVMYTDQRYQIYQFNDVCGPTGFIRHIDSLIVSEETTKGGRFVNSRRSDLRFPSLRIISVTVICGDESSDDKWESKLSSTELRRLEIENQKG